MKKILLVFSILLVLSCSSEEEEYIKDYSYFLELDTPQFQGLVNGNYMIYQFGHNTYQMASSSWNPKGDLKEPTRILEFALNQENGDNQFLISTPTYDSSNPTGLSEVFSTGIKKLGPGTDSFHIQIINNNTSFRICDVETDYKIEVLKSKEIFDDDSASRKVNVWFKIDKVHSENCSTGTNFNIQNVLILAQFIQH